jgi:hypothetical protein
VKTISHLKMINMKKLTLCLMTAFMLLTIIPTQLKAEKEVTPVSSPATKPAESTETTAEVNAILARLKEIKAMDMSKLSAAEKKELRKEVRQDRVRIRSHSNGIIYIGGGTLLLIIILILLLA